MAEDIKLDEVTAAIAAQVITVTNAAGASVTLKIRDTDNVPEAINQEMCPILIPRPANFMTNTSFTRDSFGADAGYKSFIYQLNYIFYFAPTAQGSTLFKGFGRMNAAAATILLYYMNHTNSITGADEFLPGIVESFGGVTDATVPPPLFHGFVMGFQVTKFLET